jgi:hypothetical protein
MTREQLIQRRAIVRHDAQKVSNRKSTKEKRNDLVFNSQLQCCKQQEQTYRTNAFVDAISATTKVNDAFVIETGVCVEDTIRLSLSSGLKTS